MFCSSLNFLIIYLFLRFHTVTARHPVSRTPVLYPAQAMVGVSRSTLLEADPDPESYPPLALASSSGVPAGTSQVPGQGSLARNELCGSLERKVVFDKTSSTMTVQVEERANIFHTQHPPPSTSSFRCIAVGRSV